MDVVDITILIMHSLLLVGIVLNAVLIALHCKRRKKQDLAKWEAEASIAKKHGVYNAFVGFIANFCDILGIGSFSIATSLIKVRKSLDDINIPGTMNVGFTISTCIQALLFIGYVEVDIITLVVLLVSSVVGAYCGARVVTKFNRTAIRFAMCAGLIIVGSVMICKQLNVGPFGIVGTETGLYGTDLIIGAIFSFIFGSLMNVGVGIYAPMIALILILGMDATVAFPIMSGASAYLMAFGCGPKFIKEGRIDPVTTIIFAIAGSAGALVCFFTVFKTLTHDLYILIWVVIVVIFITAILFLKDAIADVKNNKSS